MITYSLDVVKWYFRAQMDIDGAMASAKLYYRPPIELVCYLCQQAVEKVLKAYTIATENTLTKTHDLGILLEQCKQHTADFSIHEEACDRLAMYATATRYPSDIEVTEVHMKQALKDAHEIMAFTKLKLEAMGYQCDPPNDECVLN